MGVLYTLNMICFTTKNVLTLLLAPFSSSYNITIACGKTIKRESKVDFLTRRDLCSNTFKPRKWIFSEYNSSIRIAYSYSIPNFWAPIITHTCEKREGGEIRGPFSRPITQNSFLLSPSLFLGIIF